MDLTEEVEVVFPLVRRRVRLEDDEAKDVRTSAIPKRRVLFLQTVGLVLFVLAVSIGVLAWLVR